MVQVCTFKPQWPPPNKGTYTAAARHRRFGAEDIPRRDEINYQARRTRRKNGPTIISSCNLVTGASRRGRRIEIWLGSSSTAHDKRTKRGRRATDTNGAEQLYFLMILLVQELISPAEPHPPKHGEAMIGVSWNLPVRLPVYPPKDFEPFRAGHLLRSNDNPEVGFGS